jgi:transposase
VEVLEPKVLREEIVNIAYSVLCTYCTNKGTNTLSCNGIWQKPENIPHVDLTDEEWRLVREVLPQPEHAGRPRTDDRKTINGILWKLKSGAGWNTIPRKYGSSSTCHARFRSWQQNKVWENALQTLFSNSALKRI